MDRIRRTLAMACALGLAAAWAACSSSRWTDPFDGGGARSARVATLPSRTIVVVGRFENPKSSPVRWSDIGSGMAEALSRRMLADRRFEMRFNEPLASRVASIVRGRGMNVTTLLDEARQGNEDVDYVIIGRVTDFHHTAEVAGASIKRGLFGPENEAIAAIEFTIVDLRTGRIATTDHVAGVADADDDESVQQVYAGMSFGSYLFWNTPLGHASAKAVKSAADRVIAFAPSQTERMHVLGISGWREISVAGGKAHGVAKGQRYYVCATDSGGVVRALRDRASGIELKAQILEVKDETSTAWLMGEPPTGADLGAAILLRDLPRETAAADRLATGAP